LPASVESRRALDVLQSQFEGGDSSPILVAIELTRDGFPISLQLSQLIAAFASVLRQYPATAKVFLLDGAVPRPGQTLRQPDLARTLRAARDRAGNARAEAGGRHRASPPLVDRNGAQGRSLRARVILNRRTLPRFRTCSTTSGPRGCFLT